MKRFAPKDCRGESLIEILVAIVVAAVLLTGLSIVLLSSLRNAQFAQNQVKATRYAQQALDRIRSIRDRNGTITINGAGTLFGDFLKTDLPLGTSNCNGGGCFFSLVGNSSNFSLQGITPAAAFVDLADGGLAREIFVENNTATSKRITVYVQWSDNAGKHVSNLQTILTAP